VLELFDLHRDAVLRFVDRSLSSADARHLRKFIELLPRREIDLAVETLIPERVLAGTPFEIRVTVQSQALSQKAIHVRWFSTSILTVIKPTAIERDAGFRLEPGDGFSTQFSMKVVNYHVGDVPLGELVFEIDGTPIKRVSLRSVAGVDQYHPVFFWEPYHRQRLRYLETLEQAETHAPQGIAVTGQGGTGKTRFCRELGYLTEQRDGTFISVAHPQDRAQPYRIFGALVQEILGASIDPINPQESVEAYLRDLHPTLGQSARGTLSAIFSRAVGDDSTFDRDIMLQILLVLFLRLARSTCYVVHLSDLHWATVETLNLLGDVLQRLQKMASEYRVLLLMVFEGRVQTNIEAAHTAAAVGALGSTVIFESFLVRFQLERLHVQPFTGEESRSFLAHLFESAQSPDRRVANEFIPHQKVLIAEIDRYGRGNPFHMIEQIKLLRSHGVVQRNARTGLVYLAERPAAKYDAPTSVHDLIMLRLQFIETSAPDVATLIKAVGLIKDRIESGLFEALRGRLASDTPLSVIQSVEVLSADQPQYVGFRHENYYEVVRGWPVSAAECRRITDTYLDWYRHLRHKTADRLYEEALVRKRRPLLQVQRITTLLTQALDRAERTHQYQLAIQVIEELLKQSGPTGDSVPLDALLETLQLRSKLAGFLADVNDWALGAAQHEQILEFIEAYERSVPQTGRAVRTTLSYWRASSLVELANTKTDLGRSHEALRCLLEARSVCEAYLHAAKTTGRKLDEQWCVLYGRLLNRLGEANWMDGNYAESLRCIEAATAAVGAYVRSAAKKRLLNHINWLDYGAVLLHVSPRKAVRELKASCALIPAKGWPPQYAILASTTLLLGEIVECFVRAGGASVRFQTFLQRKAIPQLQDDFQRAMFHGLKQEQVAASLMLGVCLSLVDGAAAVEWYMECIETAFRSNNLESLWRGHLNLGQHLRARGDVESSTFHCGRAAALLMADLRPRRPEERIWRQRHLARPLRRLAALLEPAEHGPLQAYLTPSPTQTPAMTDRLFHDQIVFLFSGQNEYYPYGG